MMDEVAANVERQRRKQKKMEEKARAQANKMMKLDVSTETTLADSFADLNAELKSFGRAIGVKLNYLQDQYKARMVLRQGIYLSIPTPSEYRSKSKPHKLRMQPHPDPAKKTTTNDRITYLIQLLRLMMLEDAQRHEPTLQPEDNTVVRRLPVVSEIYINPLSVRLKREQETRVAAMATPKITPGSQNSSKNTSTKSCTTVGTSASSTFSTFPTKVAKPDTPAGRQPPNQFILKMVNGLFMHDTSASVQTLSLPLNPNPDP